MTGIKLNYLWVSLLKLRDRKKPLPFIDRSLLCTVPFSRRNKGENLRGGMVLLPLFMLKLLWLGPPSSSNMLDLSVLEGDAPQCYNLSFIQYPFAVTGNGSVGLAPVHGFEIECDSKYGNRPMLKFGSDRYPLLNISLREGYVRIAGRAFVSRCNGNSTSDFSPERNRVLNLTGTPYTLSFTRNKFTATGCDAMALIHGSGSSGGDDKRVSSGCVSFCVDRATVIEGVCSGVGCCQAPVPPGLKNFRLEFDSVRKLTGSRNESKTLPCSKAFVVDKAWYKFSPGDLNGYHDDEFRPVFLDWAIGNQTCKEVTRRNAMDYACKGKSHCIESIDSPDRVRGYRCMCDDGYDGNPYIPGGCEGMITWRSHEVDFTASAVD